jgi:hypothetical protein
MVSFLEFQQDHKTFLEPFSSKEEKEATSAQMNTKRNYLVWMKRQVLFVFFFISTYRIACLKLNTLYIAENAMPYPSNFPLCLEES